MLRASSVESFSLGERLRLRKVKIAVLQSHHVEEASVRIVRRRKPIRSANNPRADVRALFRRDKSGKHRAASGVNPSSPGQLLHKRSGSQKLTVGSVENIEETVAVGLEKQMTHLVVLFSVHQYRGFVGVVVIHVMRSELEIPLQLPGVRINCKDACCVEVVARPRASIEIGSGITGGPIHRVELRIVSTGHPRRGTAM